MKHLLKIVRRFEDQLLKINYIVKCRRVNTNFRHDAAISNCIVHLQNIWSLTCRNIIISSSKGNVVDIKGNLIQKSQAIVNNINPLEFLRNSWFRKPRQPDWEPDWYKTSESLKAAQLLNISNNNQVTFGLSAITILDQIRITRNFICHELPILREKYNNMCMSTIFRDHVSVFDFITSFLPSTTYRVFDIWVEQLTKALYIMIS